MLSVFDVWGDFIKGEFPLSFIFWIIISILVDVAAFLESRNDVKVAEELSRNHTRLKEAFHADVGFLMTDKTWDKYVQPALDQRAKSSKLKKIMKANQIDTTREVMTQRNYS